MRSLKPSPGELTEMVDSYDATLAPGRFSSTREMLRARQRARHMLIDEFSELANASKMSVLGKRIAHKVCVLRRDVDDVAREYGVHPSQAERYVGAIVTLRMKKQRGPGRAAMIFRDWFADCIEPAPSEVNAKGFELPEYCMVWEMRQSLAKWLAKHDLPQAYGPAQFGIYMREMGFRAVLFKTETAYACMRVKPVAPDETALDEEKDPDWFPPEDQSVSGIDPVVD